MLTLSDRIYENGKALRINFYTDATIPGTSNILNGPPVVPVPITCQQSQAGAPEPRRSRSGPDPRAASDRRVSSVYPAPTAAPRLSLLPRVRARALSVAPSTFYAFQNGARLSRLRGARRSRPVRDVLEGASDRLRKAKAGTLLSLFRLHRASEREESRGLQGVVRGDFVSGVLAPD